MLKSCPNPVDVQDILFKLHCRLRVFDNKDINTFSHAHSLISCASRFGLFFVGSNTNNLQAIQLKCVENYTAKDKDVANYPRRNVALPSPAKHVSVNCDSTILAVVVEKDTCPTVIFYDVLSFYKQTPVIIREVRLSVNPGVRVSEVNWNPALPLIFTACKSDGTLGVYELKDNSIDINELPSAAETTSFCWSPKGKQIAVGSKNGKITQYKPDLKAVKVINEPQLGGPHSLISLQWVSNYQFIGVYQSAEPEGQAKVVVVDSSKTGETNYTNYEDVCYSGTGRLPQFYMLFQQHWNLLMVASSNSTEVGVLGSTADTWTQWIISDSARAELPLSSDKQETLPVGLALDISPTKPLPWGEGTIPPCPYLLILSHQGVLCFFDIVNLKPGVPGICCPPDNVQDTSGLAQFVVEEVKESTQEKGTPTIQPQSTLTFGAPQTVAFSTAPQANSNEVKPSQTFTIPPAQPQSSTPFSMFGSATSKPITTEPKLSFTNPGNSLSNPKTSENPPLFGGQTTLAATTSPKSSAPSFKIGETVITPATIAQIPTTSDKYASIFGALNTPTSIPLASQSKPITVPGVPNSAPSAMPLSLQKPLTSTPQIPKAELKIPGKPTIPPARQVSDPKAVVDEKLKGETDALLAKMVKDECVALESELKALLHQGRRVRIDVGNNDEKLEMLNQMEALQEFIKEIVDISLGENAEVHNLKQNLILSWAWYEEALSRYNVSKNETMNLLLKAQPLDSATEKRQSDIQKLVYYLESQLSQVHKALDEQWEKFQDYAKKTHRVQMPTMEAIFQSMVRQNAVLQKQSYILKDISGRIKHKKLSASEPSLFLTLDDGTKKLENDLKRLQIDPDDPHRKLYEKPMNKRKHFTSDKRNKLRDLLKTHEVVHVTAAKPQLNSTLPFSPASRSKQIYSLLGAQMSPVQKVAVARNLDFSQSTPVRESKPEIKPTSAPPNTPAQTESQKTFTFKNLEKSLPNTVVTNSNPLFSTPKSVLNHFLQSGTQPNLPFGAPSAFVPTAQSAKLLSFTQIPEKSNVASSISSPSFSFAPTATGTIPKTTTMNVTASVPLSKTSSSTQFSFGNSITITPISKKSETLPITTTPMLNQALK
ncbi:hypothetical protein JTB14_002714 [Gonioctena quinquepunctata]|nr:hypothetical protein JTB14_002714 [Gonioctena quinquepunctata]